MSFSVESLGLIALGVIWLLIPLWLVGSLYIAWLFVGIIERQTEALESLVDLTMGTKSESPFSQNESDQV